MTDSFGFNEEKEFDLERHPTERVEELKRMVLDLSLIHISEPTRPY